ncbi:MAG TPA: endonuclease/exonuclease/phosphatase family protein [Isosphaeraceae bacterium]
MPTPAAPTSPGFWRCLKCGTPNPGTLYITACIACGYPRPPAGFEERPDAASRPAAVRHGRVPSPGLLVAVAAYGLVLLSVFLVQCGIGQSWWPGLVLSLSPRSVFLVPLVPLAVWAWRAKRPAIAAVIAVEAFFVAGPMMGFVVPWSRLTARADGPRVRIMTFNGGGARGIETSDFLRYLERQKIDVVCFQEMSRDALLDKVLKERGWMSDRSGAIASRFPIVEDYPRSTQINEADWHYTAVLYRVRVRGPEGREFVVSCLHMPTARYALKRLREFDPSSIAPYVRWWGTEFVRMFELFGELGDLPVLIGGDFNSGPDASELAAVRDSGQFQSAFDAAGLGWGYTRPASFPWARIDHILASPAWTVTSCWVGPSFGSDHKSLIADVFLSAKP